MAYSDNSNTPVNATNKDKYRNSSALLPMFFRTEANKKFLGSTLDPLISKGQLERINGFVGSRYSKTVTPEDKYVPEPTSNRRRYNLLPSVVIRDDFDDRTEWLATYDDLINQLNYFNSNTDNHDKLFSSKYYAWNPHIDFDKISNYRQYYWLPQGPSPVTITGLAEGTVSAFTVTNQNSDAWVFTPDGSSANPIIKLFRGATYKFEVNAPGHPFYIKLAKTTGALDQYEEGITNNGTENGAVVFTIPKGAPDILYYTCGVHQEMQGIFEIKNAEDELNINIPTEILGKSEYTSSNGVKFTNGLKVNFDGNVTPSTYKNKNFYVEGVGDKIKLLPVSEFDTPEGYGQNFDYEFDIDAFDETPYDDAESSPETPEYVTINRASIDKNPWTRYNRWFHKEVIEQTAKYNNTTVVLDETQRAKRPIIEFLPNIQLHNFAVEGLGNIDLIDTVTTDVFSDVEGQIGYYVDQIDLTAGMRVSFNADPDITVKGKIYEVQFVEHGGKSRLHLEEVDVPVQGQGVVVTKGVSNKGTSWYFNGTQWIKAQQKTTINQAPLFDLYDQQGVSFADSTYGIENFKGNELVSYKQGSGANDPILGFPIEYQNVNNIGDIVFEFDWDDSTFVYTNNNQNILQDTASGSIKINKSLTESVFESGWSLVDEKTRQEIVQLNDTIAETPFIEVTAIQDPGLYIGAENIVVQINGDVLKPTTGFTTRRSDNSKQLFIDFVQAIPTNSRIITKILTDRLPTDFGFYEPPVNLTNNSENNDLKTFTLGSITDHVNTIFTNDKRVQGKFNLTSNARDIKDLYKKGNRYVKHQGSLLPAMFGLIDSETNVIKAIRKNSVDYNIFKQRFIETFEQVEISGLPRDDVDDILYKLSLNSNVNSPYYYSDMAGYGKTLTKLEYEVTTFEQQVFGIQSNFNLTEISNRSIYVYYNGEHLINDVDYEFDLTDNTVILKRDTSIGDKVVVYEYETVGNAIPSTPTKLGLYPKYTPKIYVDNTYVTPTKVIQGHDGSKTVAYNDYRDDILLELEKRIYNNIKVEYKRNVFDNNEFRPGAFRKTEFNYDQYIDILRDDFGYWANFYEIDYLTNTTSVEGDVFSYNLDNTSDTINNESLPGYWRQIYKQFFDTDRPHTDPWEMIGYSEKPSWWEDRYGPAPYTNGNKILWNDLEKGFDFGTGKENLIYARPGLSKILPVNEYGELLSPIEANMVAGFISTNLNNDWVFGDGGPSEYAWRSSSWYPFAEQIALALLKPANYLTTQFDTSQNIVSPSGNTVYKSTGKIVDFTDIKIHNLYYNDIRYFGSGYHVCVVDYLKDKGQNVKTGYYDRLSNTSMNLTYKTGAFVNKERLRILLESSNPNSPDKSVFLPQENYEITFRKSNPVFTAKMSGIIVEKTDNGYLVKGYDKYQPVFKIFKPILSERDSAEVVGGTTAKFVLWQENKFYGIGQIVQYEDSYFRVKEDHTSGTTFDQSKYTRLAELPLTGGTSVQKPRRFEETVTEIPYNIVLPNVQEVYNLIIGYEKYLESIGFVFDERVNELGELSNWSFSGKEFLYWTTQAWGKGSIITLSPFAQKVKFQYGTGQVDNVLDTFYEYTIYTAGGSPLPRANISTVRGEGLFSLSTKDTEQGIYNIQLNLIQKEHVVVLDDKTIFGDIVYDQEAGYRQERIKLIGFKTTDWDGDLFSPGFVYDEAKISPWQQFRDYNLGDVVKYKTKYYSAKSFLPGVETFNYSDWIYLENEPKAELLPNLDFKISNFQDFYNLDTETFDVTTSELSQHLIGYQKRFYLDNLIQDNVSQYKFYQGFIKEKGTANAIDKISRLKVDDVQTDVTYDEEWAFKVGSLGSTSTVKEIDFTLDETLNVDNPQAYDFVSSVTTNSTPGNNIQLLANKIAVKPADYDNNPWPVTTLSATDGITSTYINKLPVAGYPRLDDIPTTAFSYNDLVGSSIINQLDDGDIIWVAKDKSKDWNVYQLKAIPARVVQTDDLKTDFLDGKITLNTDIDHNLVQGQLISVKNFNDDVDNVYLVDEVLSTTRFKVIGNDTSATLEDSAGGTILEFLSLRVTNPDDINDLKNVSKITTGTLVFADDDGTGKWAVYQKIDAFIEQKWSGPNPIVGQQFGYNIASADNGRLIVVAAPGFGDEGQIYVLGREFNTGIGTLQTTQGFAISDNSSDNIVSDAGRPALGTSLALSNDGSVLAAGAPTASNFKAVDDSSYKDNFRVSIGDFTAIPSDFSREGVVTLHTYDTEDNLFKRNYVIGCSEPETDAFFGTSLLVSNTKLLVGAPGKTAHQGKVYIYDKTTLADGSTVDWNISDHHILSISNSRDGDRFGTSMTGTKDLSLIAVSAPGYELQSDDSSASKGAVFVYRLHNNEYQLLQTISSATFDQIDAGDQFGYAVSMSENGNTLIISAPFEDAGNINAGAVFYFKKTGDDSSQDLYTYQQTIFSPLKELEEKFGSNISVNPAGDGFAVWSEHGRNVLSTSFDKYTRLEDSSLEETTLETTFDANSLKLVDENYASGTVFTYSLLNTKFVFGQKVNSETLKSFDAFGQGMNYTNNSLLIGAPNHDQYGTGALGALWSFQKVKTGGWNKLRVQEDPVDPYSVKKTFTYNTATNRVKDFLETVDPAKGKIPYLAEAEISYKSDVDPASYTQGDNSVTVRPTTAWTEEHVGELWWDLSTVAYVWYEQGDTEYRKTNWGTLFPGSSVDVYEWVETDLLPSEWEELSGTVEGTSLGFSGTPKYGDDIYVTKNIYNRNTSGFETRYYYWVKNKITTPDVANRKLPAVEVANIIEDPQAYGIKSIQLLSKNAISISNVKTTLDDLNINLNIQYRNVETDIPEHNEWQLIGEKQTKKIENELLVKKLIDSLVGYDSQGNPVPDPALPATRKYGLQIRPRQSIFADRLKALKTIITYCNDVMGKTRVVDTKNIQPLFEKDPEPGSGTGKWDVRVDDFAEISQIGTQDLVTATATATLVNGRVTKVTVNNQGYGYVNAPEITLTGDGSGAKLKANIDSRGRVTSIDVLKKGTNYSYLNLEIRPFKVLVAVDETANNNWSLYEWVSSVNNWTRTNTQTYNLNRFWSYKDYVVDGFTVDEIINHKITAPYELNTITPELGELVQIDNAGDGNKMILRKVIADGTFSDDYDLMYKAKSTIQINTNIYNYQELNFGFAGLENYDVNLFDSEPITETRKILETIRDNIFVDDLKANWNELFFIAIRHVFSEQSFVDWAFKSSFINITNNLGTLSRKLNYKISDPGYIESYVKEVKPYKTVIRNFINNYESLENVNAGTTDFDLPSYWDEENKKFVAVKITDDKISEQPYINWFDNYKFSIGRIDVTDEGAGYTEPPIVVISGGRTNKPTITQTSQFRPLVTTDYTDTRFFVKTTSIPDHGFLRNPGVNTVTAQDFTFEITRTPVEAIDKVATPLGEIGVAVNGVVFYNPKAALSEVRNGVEYELNAVENHEELGIDDGSGHPQENGVYHYHSDPRLMYTKDENNHSPLLGYALDGYPIYGPYGWDTPTGRSNPRVMKSSYRLKTTPRADGSDPDGRYIEDFEYVAGLGDLDQHNGRTCNTPEYPDGTYAYFITVDPADVDKAVYPYIIGPTYYGAPILPNGNKTLPGDAVVDATAVAYTSRGIVREIIVTNPGSGYASAPTVTLAGGGGEDAVTKSALAYAILENKKVRINTVNMAFDRLSSKKIIQTQTQTDTFTATSGQVKFKLTYLPTLDKREIDININNETVYIENYQVSIVTAKDATYKKKEGYIIFNTPPGANANVSITYKKSIDLMQATDRIDYYYQPTAGMLGKDPAQLMTGVEYDGVQVQGLEFDISVGWDGLPWFSHGWDTFSGTNTDYAFRADGTTTTFTLPYTPESGQEINVYFDNVRQDPTNTPTIVGDGNTDTFTLGVAALDGTLVVFRQKESDGSLVPTDVNNLDAIIQGGNFSYSTATGTRPEDISIDGDGFVTPDTSHAPEEVVPGQVFDSLSMQIYNSPADGSPLIVTNRYFGNSIKRNYGFDLYPGTQDSVFVSVAGVYLENGIDYTIDYQNKEIDFVDAPEIGELVTIQTLNVGGANILERQRFVNDDSTTTFRLTANYDDVKSAFVTVNGVRQDYQILEDADTGSAEILLTNPPDAISSGSIIEITALSTSEKTYSEIIKESITDDGSTMSYRLTNIPGNIAPYHNMVIAEVKDLDTGTITRLLPPDTVYYVSNGVTQSYTVSQDPEYPTFFLALGEIEVHLNGIKLVPIRDFNFDTQTNLVTFNQNVLNSGDAIAITILRNHEYEVSVTGDSAGDTEANLVILKNRAELPTNTEYQVTTFTNHDANLIRKEVYTGKLGGTYTLSRPAIDSNYIWVEIDGTPIVAERDYKVLDNNTTVEIDDKFTVTPSSRVVITTFSEEISYDSIGYRIFNDMLHRSHYKRISDQDSTKLAVALKNTDKKISLTDASFLQTPSPENKVPGVIWIDRERIEFYKINGNDLEQIVRGTLGTGVKETYAVGTKVFDAGPSQTVPYIETVNVYEGVIRDGLPNGTKEHVLETINISSSAEAHDQVEVYLGGRKLQKPTVSTNPIKIHDVEIAFDSNETNSTGVESDVLQTPEFTIEAVGDSSGKNYYKLVLRDEPQLGLELKVIQKQGRVWHEQGVNTASTGTTLQRAETAQAKFLLERPSGLPVINIRE